MEASVILVIFDAKTHSLELPPSTPYQELFTANTPLPMFQLTVGGFWHHIFLSIIHESKSFLHNVRWYSHYCRKLGYALTRSILK